ncbi:hypothetical protein BDP27DRAFT_62412 [Rhodocollybia butyracea]|uniref:Uncharacterized protein n=1 Tax=Rhodocollybia butyracea TaxID=206335 RepID=A0A9P5U524_9AGAR|nr:hypothetical protein BDP27DRAFT_62412 [Rhodocollybia butyracea]
MSLTSMPLLIYAHPTFHPHAFPFTTSLHPSRSVRIAQVYSLLFFFVPFFVLLCFALYYDRFTFTNEHSRIVLGPSLRCSDLFKICYDSTFFFFLALAIDQFSCSVYLPSSFFILLAIRLVRLPFWPFSFFVYRPRRVCFRVLLCCTKDEDKLKYAQSIASISISIIDIILLKFVHFVFLD